MIINSPEFTSKFNAIFAIKMKASVLKCFMKSDQIAFFLETLDNLLTASEETLAEKIEAVSLPNIKETYLSMVAYYVELLYSGKSLLMFAAEENHLDLLRDILACKKVQINEMREDLSWDLGRNGALVCYAGDEHGYAALMYAIKEGNVEAAELLIRAFANLYQKNSHEENAFKLARTTRDQTMQKLLQRAPQIQAEEIFWSLMTCKMTEVIPLMELQGELQIPKIMVIEYILNNISNNRYQAMLLRQALQVNALGEPANALSLYVFTDNEDEFSGSDVNTIRMLQSRLKTLEGLTSSPTTAPFTVLTRPGKPAHFSYAYAYGPQQMRHPLEGVKKDSAALLAFSFFH
jgi:hypothetical protein